MKKNYYLLIAALLTCALVACQSSSSPEQKVIDPQPQPQSVAYTWAYVTEIPKNNKTPYDICGKDFQLDSPCATLNEFCKINTHLYACFPADLNITFTGKVLDLNGNGLSGVHVTFGYVMHKQDNDRGVTTDDQGRFTIKSTSCAPIFWAQKDGYQSLNNYYFATTSLPNCEAHTWSYSDITLKLQALNRTVDSWHDRNPTSDRCTMSGRVLDTKNVPISGAEVTANTKDVVQATTDNDGYYLFDFVGACPEYCSVYKDGYVNPKPEFTSQNHVSCFMGKPGDFLLKKIDEGTP